MLRDRVLSFISASAFTFTAWQCCSLVIPPVTLTGSKTAIEKQIIGNQNEIEKDVWMISSAKTTKNVATENRDEKKTGEINRDNAYVFEGLSLVEVYSQRLAQLKADRVVGENSKGLLSNLLEEKDVEIPEKSRKKYDSKFQDDMEKGLPWRTLTTTVKEMNRARGLLAKGYIAEQLKVNPKFKLTEEELLKQQAAKYREAALKGEFIQEKTAWKTKT